MLPVLLVAALLVALLVETGCVSGSSSSSSSAIGGDGTTDNSNIGTPEEAVDHTAEFAHTSTQQAEQDGAEENGQDAQAAIMSTASAKAARIVLHQIAIVLIPIYIITAINKHFPLVAYLLQGLVQQHVFVWEETGKGSASTNEEDTGKSKVCAACFCLSVLHTSSCSQPSPCSPNHVGCSDLYHPPRKS